MCKTRFVAGVLLFLVLSLILAGCASSIAPLPQPTREMTTASPALSPTSPPIPELVSYLLKNIQVGQTTRAQVEALLGAPCEFREGLDLLNPAVTGYGTQGRVTYFTYESPFAKLHRRTGECLIWIHYTDQPGTGMDVVKVTRLRRYPEMPNSVINFIDAHGQPEVIFVTRFANPCSNLIYLAYPTQGLEATVSRDDRGNRGDRMTQRTGINSVVLIEPMPLDAYKALRLRECAQEFDWDDIWADAPPTLSP